MSSKRDNSSSSSSAEGTSSTRYSGLSRSSPDGRASFAATAGQQLAAALDSVINAGDLLSLSRTSDGGAICIYVKSGQETFKGYAATQADLDEALQSLTE